MLDKKLKATKKLSPNLLQNSWEDYGAWQTTLKRAVQCEGTGVHSGQKVRLELHPAPAHQGRVFLRTDGRKAQALIPADWRYVSNTRLCTQLSNAEGITLSTVEHLMAALAGLGIDNVLIKVDGAEVPIMDGSAAPFVELIEDAGIEVQPARRKSVKVLREVRVGDAYRSAVISPGSSTVYSFECIFDKPSPLQDQTFSFELTPSSFLHYIAKARTFGFVEEVEALQAMGLARGASLDNAVGLTASGVANPEGLRFADECVRHKILDAVGDLALAGMPVVGHFHGVRSGHELNYQLVKALMSSPEAYEIVTLGEDGEIMSSTLMSS